MRRMLPTGGLLLVIWLLVSVVLASPPVQITSSLDSFILDVRIDQELLADRVFGGGVRPDAWTGNVDITSDSILADLWFDNELLADDIFGVGSRPEGWIGATTSNVSLLVRNIRHDLELAADRQLGAGARPEQWTGSDPFFTCSRTLMNTTYLLETRFEYELTVGQSVRDYCRTLAGDINDNLLDLSIGEAIQESLPANILAVRGDLERLADEVRGLGDRPPGWSGNRDVNSPDLVSDNFADLDLLAVSINQRQGLPEEQRPENWQGSAGINQLSAYRNMRFDLELLADQFAGPDQRPGGWQGTDPLLRCDSETQNLVLLVQQSFEEFTLPETALEGEAFCQQALFSANSLVENPPVIVVEEEDEDTRFMAEAEFAFAYLDPAATQYMGMVPGGTNFRAWYRNFGDSSMMFVSGDNFAVFIDRRWTTMTEETFTSLPTLEGINPLTFCDANWCNGPSPTPTPTGGGPLLEIARGDGAQATPLPGQGVGGDGIEGKTLVSWDHIRVNYVLQQPDVGRAQVTLEICQEVAQISCEPVLSVFNTNTGVPVAVVSQFNGLNVYELPYGYNTGLLIEGNTLYSGDVWLNDPALSGG